MNESMEKWMNGKWMSEWKKKSMNEKNEWMIEWKNMNRTLNANEWMQIQNKCKWI